jgi:nitrous oxide reductase accessory protein NosL
MMQYLAELEYLHLMAIALQSIAPAGMYHAQESSDVLPQSLHAARLKQPCSHAIFVSSGPQVVQMLQRMLDFWASTRKFITFRVEMLR